ncbi:protein-ADP-ribose hydrolase [Propionibacterium australiense]|nr:protein-ADP-ribose hydrolase [Propionibacterium australiense]
MTTDSQAMSQAERRRWLLDALLAEDPEYARLEVPAGRHDQQRLLRGLMNVRMPAPVSEDFLAVQDAYLRELTAGKGVTSLDELTPAPHDPDLFCWQGDITTLGVDAIVNAANNKLLGCFVSNHRCVDNAIHSSAGVQLRVACAELMRAQGHDEPTGTAKITPGFNLPAHHVIHTVGPVVTGPLTAEHRELLASCYRSALALADESGLASIAFCCVSTGEFGFPNDAAATVALGTIRDYKERTGSALKVVLNVFTDLDLRLYNELLGGHRLEAADLAFEEQHADEHRREDRPAPRGGRHRTRLDCRGGG